MGLGLLGDAVDQLVQRGETLKEPLLENAAMLCSLTDDGTDLLVSSAIEERIVMFD